MKLRSWGGTSDQRKLVNNLTRFSANKLMTKRLADTLTVHIALVKDLFKKEGIYGDAGEAEEEWYERRPKVFKIRVDSSMLLRPMLTTIAHEMVHVKQYAKGELRSFAKNNNTRYKDKVYNESVDYWEQPWEIEAHGWERSLFELWIKDQKLLKEKWTNEELYPRGYWNKI